MEYISKIASAIYNDIQSGLSGYNSTLNMSIEQLEDEVVQERLAVIKTYSAQNLIPVKDLIYSLNCIETDCKDLSKCCESTGSTPQLHFEIPQIINDFGEKAIDFIGSTDKNIKFKVYTNPSIFKYHQYKTRGANKPYVFIDTTPNEHNMYDGYIFNAPLLERLTVRAIFKDPRQLEQYSCCNFEEQDNMSFIESDIKDRLTKKKLAYYRQNVQTPIIIQQPNNQIPK